MKAKQVIWYECSTCTNSFPTHTQAEACCRCPDCSVGCPDDKRCKECRKKHESAAEERTIADATVVSWDEYDDERLYSANSDRFFASLDEVFDYYDDNDYERPEWLWAVERTDLSFDADSVLEDAFSVGEHAEELREYLTDADVKELQTALDAWAETRGLFSYHADYMRRVMLPLDSMEINS